MWTGALSGLPSSAPLFPDPVRFTPDETEQVIAGIGAGPRGRRADDRRADGGAQRAGRGMGGGADDARIPGPVAALAAAPPAPRPTGASCASGATRGRNVTYTNPHRWLPGFVPDGADAAVRTLIRALPPRLRPRDAPALRQVAQRAAQAGRWKPLVRWPTSWSRSSPGEAGVGRWPATLSEGEPAAVAGIQPPLYFDAYVVAAQPRELLYPGAAGARALSRSGQAGNYPVMLVDGVVGGVWHQRRSGRRLDDHGRAAGAAQRGQPPRARGGGRARRHGHGGPPDAGHRRGDGRPPRLTQVSAWLQSPSCPRGWLASGIRYVIRPRQALQMPGSRSPAILSRAMRRHLPALVVVPRAARGVRAR